MLYRHGDVLLARVEVLPTDAKRVLGHILVRGEATGHAHRIEDPRTAEVFRTSSSMFLHVIAPEALLVHEEHTTIRLPAGVYRVWQQREYTPEAIRTVVD